MQQQSKEDRSLGELFGELTRQTTDLVKQEVALAKTELTQKASKAGREIGFLAIGGAIAYAGLLAIIAAVIILLAMVGVPWWLSALLVGLVVAGAGYFLIQRGLAAIKQIDLAPRQTIATIKEDTEWAKEQTKS